jgi:ABC-type multidrug transport system fused ATPase/permease subunit
MLMGITTTVFILVALLIGEITIYNYLTTILLCYFIIEQTTNLISVYLDLVVVRQRENLLVTEIQHVSRNHYINLLHDPIQIGSNSNNAGVSIDFKNFNLKIQGKSVLEVKDLHIASNDIIGIIGNGSHLFTSVIMRLLKSISGTVSLDGHDINIINQSSLTKLVSVISNNLHDSNISIL